MLDRTEAAAPDTGYGYLDLLARAKAALATSREVAVPVDDLRPFPDQPRHYFGEDSLVRLMESIDGSGQTTTGLIRENPGATRYELIDGERRWRAIRMIPADRRPAYRARLIDADDEVVRYLISGIANFNREGHTALETSDTISRLLGFGLPMREIASLLGISVLWAGQMHGLRNLADNVRGLMDPALPKARRLPITAAVEISKVAKKLQFGLAQRVLSREVSLAGLRAEAVGVSKRTGHHVRERVVPRDERWKGLRRKIGHLELAAMDAQRLLSMREVQQFATTRTATEKRELAARLKNVQQTVGELVRSIEGR